MFTKHKKNLHFLQEQVKLVLRLLKFCGQNFPLFFTVNDKQVLHILAAGECETGWVASNSSCYLFVNESLNYASAESWCELLGATLVSIGDADENAFVAQR